MFLKIHILIFLIRQRTIILLLSIIELNQDFLLSEAGDNLVYPMIFLMIVQGLQKLICGSQFVLVL